MRDSYEEGLISKAINFAMKFIWLFGLWIFVWFILKLYTENYNRNFFTIFFLDYMFFHFNYMAYVSRLNHIHYPLFALYNLGFTFILHIFFGPVAPIFNIVEILGQIR